MLFPCLPHGGKAGYDSGSKVEEGDVMSYMLHGRTHGLDASG